MFLDGIWLKRCWGGEVRNVAVLVAVGVSHEGYREVLGVMEGAKEDKESWVAFLRHLKGRGLAGVRLVVSDKCLGLVESLAEFYPAAAWQRCAVHFYRNVFTAVPKGKLAEVAAMLKAVHAQEDVKAARDKIQQVVEKLEGMRLGKAAGIVRAGIEETLAYMAFPREHWRSLRTNNMLERLMRELRRRTRVVGCFPDGESALMLVGARLRHVAGTAWSTRRYLDMGHLREHHGDGEWVDLSVPPAAAQEVSPAAGTAAASLRRRSGLRAEDFAASCGDQGGSLPPPGPPLASLCSVGQSRATRASKGQTLNNSKRAEQRPNRRTANKSAKDLLRYLAVNGLLSSRMEKPTGAKAASRVLVTLASVTGSVLGVPRVAPDGVDRLT